MLQAPNRNDINTIFTLIGKTIKNDGAFIRVVSIFLLNIEFIINYI